MSFFNTKQRKQLTIGSCRKSFVDLCPTFFINYSANSHSALLANGSHGGFPSNCCTPCKISKLVFSLLNESPAGPRNGSTYRLGVHRSLSWLLSVSSTLAWLSASSKWCVGSGLLGRSSTKLGSGEFMCFHLGDELSFFLMMLLCHSFRQIIEAEICCLTPHCVAKVFWQNWQHFDRGGMVRSFIRCIIIHFKLMLFLNPNCSHSPL